jgi:ribonuclease HIII
VLSRASLDSLQNTNPRRGVYIPSGSSDEVDNTWKGWKTSSSSKDAKDQLNKLMGECMKLIESDEH